MPLGHDWQVGSHAVSVEQGPNGASAIWHPNYPFEGSWSATETGLVPQIARTYLETVAHKLGLPDLLTSGGDFRERTSGAQLSWLPITAPSIPTDHKPPATPEENPRHSFWITRYRNPGDASTVVDRTAIFLVVQSFEANEASKPLGSRIGIRIVAHVSTAGSGPWRVRITGASCSAGLAASLDTGDADFSVLTASLLSDVRSVNFKARIATAARLSGQALYIDGLRVIRPIENDALIDVFVNAPRQDWRSIPYALTVRLAGNLRAGPMGMRVQSIERRALIAHAQVTTRLLQRDPPSQAGTASKRGRQPNRAPDKLDAFLRPTTLQGIADINGSVSLADNSEIDVKQSRVVDRGANEDQTQVVSLAASNHARTNPFAALSAYQRALELFDRMKACGFAPATYFRNAALPLHMRYRAPIRPGPGKDGRTINAQVDFDPASYEIGDSWNSNLLRPLQVRFGGADLRRSFALSRREPLGMAADRRWSWHEFGHVLLAASTGMLELPFAHSVGDALAAIISDPDSRLASHTRARGATFPWVYLNRRHDRSVRHGWGWCGMRHRQRRFPPGGSPRHKGYDSEQILGTTLFRLYLTLGGNTIDKTGAADVAARQEAAHYAVYLIMRTIWEIGDLSAAPIETPSQFEAALKDADVATVTSGPGDPLGERIGGCAHKLIRWAFEAQGLSPSPDWDAMLNEPGKPPVQDLFIDDNRPDVDAPANRGGYMPVSLDWESYSPPRWHADGHIRVNGPNVFVDVRNRGQQDVTDAVVKVWYATRPAGSSIPPKWNSKSGGTPNWTAAPLPTPIPPATVHAWPAAAVQFGPYQLPAPNARYWILAAATCAGDPANTEAVTGLQCVTAETRIVDLVSGDNNIGLVKAGPS